MSKTIVMRDVDSGQITEIDTDKNTQTFRDPGSGHMVTMDLGIEDVTIGIPIATYAAGYKLAEGIADKVCPVLKSATASAKYPIWDADDAFQPAMDVSAAPGAAVKEISPRLSTTQYQTVEYALGAFVPTEVETAGNTGMARINVNLAYGRRVMNAMLIARELRVTNLLRSTAAWGANAQVLIAAEKWNGGASSDPLQNLINMIESSLTPIDALVMTWRTYIAFIMNPKISALTQFKPNVSALPKFDELQAALAPLALPPILITNMKYKDPAGAHTYIWGNDVVGVHLPPGGMPLDGQDISTCYTWRWDAGGTPDGTLQNGWLVRNWFNQNRGPRGGRQLVITHNDAEVLCGPVAGGMIKDAFQP